MDMHEDVAFDPGVGAVEVEAIIRSAIKDVVDELQNGVGAIATGEVDGVVETPGMAEIVIAENAVAIDRDAIDAMKAFGAGWRRVAGEVAVLDDERTAIE